VNAPRKWDWRDLGTDPNAPAPRRIGQKRHNNLDISSRIEDLRTGYTYAQLSKRWGMQPAGAYYWCTDNEELLTIEGVVMPTMVSRTTIKSTKLTQARLERIKEPWTIAGLAKEWGINMPSVRAWINLRAKRGTR